MFVGLKIRWGVWVIKDHVRYRALVHHKVDLGLTDVSSKEFISSASVSGEFFITVTLSATGDQ